MSAVKTVRRYRRAVLLAACAAPLLAAAAAAAPNYFTSKAIGITSGDFLNLPVGARAIAMGGAYTAVSEEASAIYWNPAGLIQIPKLSAIFMRSQYVAETNYQYAAYAHRIGFDSVVGGSVFMTDIGSIDHTDISGTRLGSFTPRDQVYTISYSKAILEFSDKDMDVSIGVSGRYISSRIYHSAKSYAADVGVMTYNFTAIPYRLGLVVSNLGNGLRYDQESSPIPLTVRMGGAVNPFRNMLVSADAVFSKSNRPYMNFGGELATEPNELTRLSLRAGLNTARLSDGLSGFTLGAGATMHFFSLDYAFVPMGELGTTHNISLTFDFPFRSPIFQRRDRSVFTRVESLSIQK
ncbi:MAG TPA: PorV/PorQ family protein [Elusimicrobiales bacterium]|nr:PorV/PorQ family protein [Elusimicrobiales bacterium]